MTWQFIVYRLSIERMKYEDRSWTTSKEPSNFWKTHTILEERRYHFDLYVSLFLYTFWRQSGYIIYYVLGALCNPSCLQTHLASTDQVKDYSHGYYTWHNSVLLQTEVRKFCSEDQNIWGDLFMLWSQYLLYNFTVWIMTVGFHLYAHQNRPMILKGICLRVWFMDQQRVKYIMHCIQLHCVAL